MRRAMTWAWISCSGTLKDVQDAGVAENAADFKFQGEAIAAVNLQGVVGGGPGDAGA